MVPNNFKWDHKNVRVLFFQDSYDTMISSLEHNNGAYMMGHYKCIVNHFSIVYKSVFKKNIYIYFGR